MFARFLAALVILATAIALAIAAWPQLFGLQTTPVIAHVVSLRGLAVGVALVAVVACTVVALLAARARRFFASLAVVGLVFAAASTAVLATRGFGDTAFDSKTEADVTVLSWNTLGDAPGASVIADLVADTDADIVSLPETTFETGSQVAGILQASGIEMEVFTIPYDLVSKARSTTLLIASSLGDYVVNDEERTTSVLPSVVATPANGSGPVIVAVHPVAPVPGEMQNWRDDLQWLKNSCSGDNVILAGDFNSTLDHYEGLATADGATIGNCADASLASENAAVGTWPTSLPALLGSPIDRVMATPNWHVSGMRVVESHDGYGSDHRPVVVQLSPAG